MKYFSMFTGIGGFEEGIKRATNDTWECIGFSEIDKYCNYVLKYKYKGVINYGDAKKINPNELPDFDLLCGGFPCQSFSIAGKRGGFEDTRGTLFFEVARILKAKRPSYCLLENVKGLLNHDEGKTFGKIIQTLSELGYDVQWMVLNSKFFGVPQNRERVFVIGSLGGKPKPEILPFGESTEEIPRISGEETKVYKREGFNPRTHPRFRESKDSPTLTQNMGTGGNNCPMIMDYRKDEGFRERDNESPTLTSHGNSNGGIPIPMVMNLQTRDINRPSIKKRLEAGLKPNAGSGTICKEDEAYCLDSSCTQGVAFAMRAYPRTGKDDENRKQRFEPRDDGVTNTLTSVEKDNLICPTITCELAHQYGRVFTPKKFYEMTGKLRRLTPIECERLQSFEDNWTKFGINDEGKTIEISDTQRYRMCGNAVSVCVIEAIIRRLNE